MYKNMENSPILHATTVHAAVDEITRCLQQYPLAHGQGIETALDEAAYLVSFVVGLPPDFCPADHSENLTQPQCQRLLDALTDRVVLRRPLAYVLGETWQGGYPFYVNESVLIPRSPIAELIAQRFSPWWQHAQEPQFILDLCAGSGCLGILAALQFAQAQVDLADIDQAALTVAQKNIERHHLATRVSTIVSDVYQQLPAKTYDIILCNPPYVPETEQDELPSEYHHEPSHALFAGRDGLTIVKRILPSATKFLARHGMLVLEVGQSAAALQEHYPHYDFMWLDFEHGGEGVCLLTYDDCKNFSDSVST